MIEKFFELSKLVSNKQTIIEKLVKSFCCCKFFARIGKIPLSIVRRVIKIIFLSKSRYSFNRLWEMWRSRSFYLFSMNGVYILVIFALLLYHNICSY